MLWFGHDSTLVEEILNFASLVCLKMPITPIFSTLNLVLQNLPLSQPPFKRGTLAKVIKGGVVIKGGGMEFREKIFGENKKNVG